jgi:hypothetical protein
MIRPAMNWTSLRETECVLGTGSLRASIVSVFAEHRDDATPGLSK